MKNMKWIGGVFMVIAGLLQASAKEVSVDVQIKSTNGWMMMRQLPIPFPNEMSPVVPEAHTNVLNLGNFGRDSVIVIPDQIPDTMDGKVFDRCVKDVFTKMRGSKIVRESDLTAAERSKHLIVFGISSGLESSLQGIEQGGFLNGLYSYGYRIKMFSNPFASGRNAVLVLGKDWKGAASAATVFYMAVRRQKDDMGNIKGWPVSFPEDTTLWLPFEARYTLKANTVQLPDTLPAMPPVPQIPCGVRIWGGPMPTLESWQRLLREAKKMNINSVIVQSGGWVDVENPGEFYKTAMDIAQAEGVYVTMYVGNETVPSHHAAAWTENYPRIINAIKDHPALLHFALYNQLTRLTNMTDEEKKIIEEQIRYIRKNTNKSIDIEVNGDHTNPRFVPEKVALMQQLKDWGVEIISTDVAPVGGWTKNGDHLIWETRIAMIHELGLIPMNCMQTHIPFTGPAIPTKADVHLQFWLNVAAGAKGFYYEAAYVFNGYSIRGLMTWNLQLQPDGRAAAVTETLGCLPALEDMLTTSQKVNDPESKSGLAIETADPAKVLVRMRTDGKRSWLILINSDVKKPADFTLKRTGGISALTLRELAPGRAVYTVGKDVAEQPMHLEPGCGICFEMQ